MINLKIKPRPNGQGKENSEEHQASDCDGAGQEKGCPEVAKESGFGVLVIPTLGVEEEKLYDPEIHCHAPYSQETYFRPPSWALRTLLAFAGCDSCYG
jgi:hypothetical protein